MSIAAGLTAMIAALASAGAHRQAPGAPPQASAAEPTPAPAADTAHFGERAPVLRIGDALPVIDPSVRLRVGIADLPPWTIPPSEKVPYWSGLAAQAWKDVTTELKLDYEVVQLSLDDATDALAKGQVDVLVTGLAIHPENLVRFTMTPPFDLSGISIATRIHSNLSFRSVINRVASVELASWLLMLVGSTFVFGCLFWAAERRRNPPIEGPAARGIRESFWWSAVTLTTVGYGDRVPVTRSGRIVAMVWMAVGFVLITVSAGVVTSTLTVASLQPVVTGATGLARAKIGTMKGSTGEAYLQRTELKSLRFESFEEAMRELAAERLDAVVGSTTTLVFLAERSGGRHVTVLPRPLVRDFVGIAMRFGLDPALEKRIDLAVLKAAQSPEYRALRATMMGQTDTVAGETGDSDTRQLIYTAPGRTMRP
ncbi:MAG: transporter substrate-binding domain-containing protein [Planctomycetes bacterium]|nr:transporter substrate-binding domain-containing protein [Planctomycetota bacterium]